MKKRGVTRLFLAVGVVVVILLVVVSFLMKDSDKEQFYASPPNQPPIFLDFGEQIFACEGSTLSYQFKVKDPDDDVLEFDIFPKYGDPFFVRSISQNPNATTAEIFSAKLDKSQVNSKYPEEIFASDGSLTESVTTEISVIEINNPPEIEDINTQTISLDGNTTFYKKVEAFDMESPDEDLSFFLTFLEGREIFSINGDGEISFEADSSHIGNYEINVCVKDKALLDPHEHIAICDQDGSEQITCDKFHMTIVEQNNQPTIQSFTPTDVTLNESGSKLITFEVFKFDPDGTALSTRWYVDDVIKEVGSEEGFDKFQYVFGCGLSGAHTIKAEVTDGLLNDFVTWNVSLTRTKCPFGTPIGTDLVNSACEERWACNDWDLCQRAASSNEIGLLGNLDYQKIVQKCELNSWDEESCGFQIRFCFDLNICNTIDQAPTEMRECRFSLGPSCSDGIKNCHDQSCELLVDCGGPCVQCPTCSDGTKNQEEVGVDCGGTCPNLCTTEKPFVEKESVKYTIIAILVFFLIGAIILILRITKIKRELKVPSRHEKGIEKIESKI